MRLLAIALLTLGLAAPLGAQADAAPADTGRFRFHFAFKFVFSPEQVVKHQVELAITDTQRKTMQAEILKVQQLFGKGQWQLSAANEKLAALLEPAHIDEGAAMAAVDQILQEEYKLKRVQMMLLIRMKNTLTPAQQRKLMQIREEP